MAGDHDAVDLLYRHLFEYTPDGVFLTQPDGTVLRANPAACRLLGRSEASIVDGGRAGVVVDSPALRTLLAERAANGVATGELEFLRGDGTIFPVEITSALIPGDITPGYACTIFRDITRRRASEGLLRRSEAMLRDITDAVPEPIFVKDRLCRWTFVNPATLSIVGKRLDEVVGRTDTEIYGDAEVGEALARVDRRVMASGITEVVEEIVRTPTGDRVYLSTKAPLRATDGTVVGLVGSARDITLRKRAEAALLEREHVLRESQRIAHIGTWIWDLAANRILWSAENYHIFGLEDDGQPLVPDACLALVHADDRAEVAAWVRACAAGNAPGEVEFRIRRPDGGERLLLGRGELVAATDVRPHRLIGTMQDITERKRSEQDRDRLTTAIEQASEAVVVTDTTGSILYVNPAFEAITGYVRDEVRGQTPRVLKSGAQDDASYRDLWATITSGRTWRGRLVNRKKDGTTYTEDASISPVRDASGATTAYVAVKRDVSHHLALEAQLQQSQKMEGIGRLAGGVAHDFNNLLSVILSYTDLILDQLRPGDPLRDDIDEIVHASQRAAALTRQLLAFSRKQILQPVVLDLNEVISELERMLGRVIGEDITLDLRLSPSLWLVKADAGQMEQVLMNLVTNARDAMPQGGRLAIETSNVELDEAFTSRHAGAVAGPHVCIAVTDSGSGMDAQTAARIFEPFFTTKAPGRGTGLGLSTVYGIVKQSGGTIYVESVPRHGTTFQIFLPRDASSDAAPHLAQPVARRAGGTERILVVEDEDAVRKLAVRILEAAGYTVVPAGSGAEAIGLVEASSEPIDLVLTDVVMPQMSGRAMMDRLGVRWSGLKVLYMSGYTDDAILRHGILDPGVQFMAKPLTQGELLSRVREVLDGALS